jgi:hypothetical protein
MLSFIHLALNVITYSLKCNIVSCVTCQLRVEAGQLTIKFFEEYIRTILDVHGPKRVNCRRRPNLLVHAVLIHREKVPEAGMLVVRTQRKLVPKHFVAPDVIEVMHDDKGKEIIDVDHTCEIVLL